MARLPRARIALPVLLGALLSGCGDPGTPAGDGEGSSGAAGPASTDTTGAPGTPTTTQPATTGDEGTGTGDGSTGGDATTLDATTLDATTGPAACGPDALTLAGRGYIPRGGSREGVALARCGEDRWYFAAPSESTWELLLTRTSGGALAAALAYPDEPLESVWGAALATSELAAEQPASVVFPVPRSGEFALHVRADDPEEAATYDLEIRCVLGCERETTRFPVVLVHGWTGFESIGPLTYFFGVAAMYEEMGFAHHVAVLDPYNDTLVRAGQLVDQIDEILPQWRARKVDLLGHSQGGVDSRCAVSTFGYGDRVSAVMTIASPHRGTYVTDLALGLAPGGVEDLVGLLLNFVGAVTAQQKSDAMASFYSLSEKHMQEEFNPQNPDDPRVQYISYTGRTCSALQYLDPANDCQDLCDPLIGWSHDILEQARGANDGLVTVESAKWGEYRGEMIADHIDEVGQILGVTDPKFDHMAFYRDRARELAAGQH